MLYHVRKAEDRQISQAVDDDGNNEVFFYFIGHGKQKTSDHLCDGKGAAGNMR